MKKLILSLLMICPHFLCGQVLSDSLPLSSAFVEGKLSNGLRYYIRKNGYPKKKAELRLVLNVGSVLETKKERGAAHFLEHMAFKGTETFPDNTILTLFEYMGIKFGYDLNAFTGYDQTIYIMPVPTDDEQNIPLALTVLKEWLSAINLSAADIEKEKKIVQQEIRDKQQDDSFYALKIQGSRYADRDVLGSEESIAGFDSTLLRNYYDRWYRPDLATVVVVGDCNPQEVEKKIIELFAPLKTRGKKTFALPHYSLPLKSKSLFKSIPDKLLSQNRLELIIPVKELKRVSYADLREILKIDLFKELLYNRLRDDDSLSCGFSRNWYLADISHTIFELSARSDTSLIQNIEKLAYKLAQISQHGFLPEELEKGIKKLSFIHPYSDSVRSSTFYCDDIIDLVINGDRPLTKELKDSFKQKILPSIGEKELRALVDELIQTSNRRIWCYQYNPTLSAGGSKKEMNRAWLRGINSNTELYTPSQQKKKEPETAKPKTLPDFELPDSKVVYEKYFEDLDITEMLLSNGLRLILKPIKQTKGKEIQLSLSGRGGFSTLPKGKYPFYESTAAYMEMAGASSLSYEELSDYAYEQKVSLVLNIFNYHHEMLGVAFHGKLEAMLKLLYARVVASDVPRKEIEEDKERKIALLGKEGELSRRLRNSSEWQKDKLLVEIKAAAHMEDRELQDREEINRLNADSIFSFYERLFGCSDRLTAVVAGKIDNEEDKKMLVRYLAALPNKMSCDSIQNVGTKFSEGIRRETVGQSSEEGRVEVAVVFHSLFDFSLRNTVIVKLMTNIVQQRLVSSLREKHGMVYSPHSTVFYRSYPQSEVYFELNYSCDKKNEQRLEALLVEEIEQLKKKTISSEELIGLKRAFMISKTDYLDEFSPAPWREKLKTFALEGVSLEEMNSFDRDLESITEEELREAFVKYWNLKNYTLVTIK